MRRKARVRDVVRQLHRGFVWTCFGVSVLALGLTGAKLCQYYFTKRPSILQERETELGKLLAEGSSDRLLDVSPNIEA